MAVSDFFKRLLPNRSPSSPVNTGNKNIPNSGGNSQTASGKGLNMKNSLIFVVNNPKDPLAAERQIFKNALYDQRFKNWVNYGIEKLAETNKNLATAFQLFAKGIKFNEFDSKEPPKGANPNDIKEIGGSLQVLEEAYGSEMIKYEHSNELTVVPYEELQQETTKPAFLRINNIAAMQDGNGDVHPIFRVTDNPVYNFAKDKVGGYAKDVLHDFAGRAFDKVKHKLPENVAKFAQKALAKKAATKVATTAATTVAKVAAEGTATVAGAGLTGGASLILQAALIIGEKLINIAKNAASFLSRALTGEKDKDKQAVMLLFMGGLAAGLMGAPVLSVLALGGGTFMVVVNGVYPVSFFQRLAIAGATIWTGLFLPMLLIISIIFYIFIVPLIVAFIYIIVIDSGAYVVPPNPYRVIPFEVVQQYVGVEKTVEPSRVKNISEGGPVTLEYTVRIWAKIGCVNITAASNEYSVFGDSTAAPPAAPGDIENLVGETICPADNDFNGYTFEYSLTINDDRYKDSFLSDTVTVSVITSDGATETSNDSASVIIGDPPTDCLIVSDNARPWPGNERNIMQAAVVEFVGKHPIYAAKVCAGNAEWPPERPVNFCYDPPDVDYWGWHIHTESCDIKFSDELNWHRPGDLQFIIAHEVAHHLQKLSSEYMGAYASSGAEYEAGLDGGICSYRAGQVETEWMAEALGLYASVPSYTGCISPSFSEKYPLNYQFAKNVMYEE